METYRSRLRSGASDHMAIVVIVVVVIGLLGIGTLLVSSYNKFHTRVTEVCSKERAATDDGAEYRIYTDTGTFVMKDILIGGTRFNTADAYGRIKEGAVYKITYKGWRFGLFSMFPNIVKAEVAPEGARSSGGGC